MPKLKPNKYLLMGVTLLFISSCKLTGVDEESDSSDSTVVFSDTTGESELGDELLQDTVNGLPNNMVFQREDGLRVEWTIKNPSEPIELNDVVMVNYTARVAAGEVYDSNKELGNPVPLKTNIGMMIPGWEQGLLEMNIGDKGRIMIPSALAYGENGYLTVVPPNADIIVDIEVVSRIIPITLEEGVKVYKWQTVSGGEHAKKNQFITFDYFAYRKGKKAGLYDNSYQNGEPFSFKFENANVIDGLHQGMSILKEGENAFIEIPASLAYGKKGLLDLVPGNTDIVYDVRIIAIQ